MTHATDNDNISPENAEPPNKKASKSGSRENTVYLKTALHWNRDLTIDLGEKGRVKLWRKYGVKRVEIFRATALLR